MLCHQYFACNFLIQKSPSINFTFKRTTDELLLIVPLAPVAPQASPKLVPASAHLDSQLPIPNFFNFVGNENVSNLLNLTWRSEWPPETFLGNLSTRGASSDVNFPKLRPAKGGTPSRSSTLDSGRITNR